ncbi:MAG: E3 binding domain-containing protein [Chloroflexi bacterium]|nr:E3 binding domain-containing protein [Chloroflexota bacterium]
MTRVILPQIGANMTEALIAQWHKKEGDWVEKGEVLASIETDKAVVELEAEESGELKRILTREGETVAVLSVIALMGDEEWEEVRLDKVAPIAAVASSDGNTEYPINLLSQGRVPASPAARRLAREKGVELKDVTGTGPRGEVTIRDVATSWEGGGGVSISGGGGALDPHFFSLLSRDREGFSKLSSEMKVHLYRIHGAVIGQDVRLEAGSVIVAQKIVIGPGTVIGEGTIIDCDRLRLGRMVSFGTRVQASCREIDIGDLLYTKEDVVIGGGGHKDPGAKLKVGDMCFFGTASYINPCHPITLGNEVCLAPKAIIFTHSHWQSILEGYPARWGPVAIGNHVFLGVNCFVFPGVTIGDGAAVMVNSYVTADVPPRTLVGGVPATVIKAAGRDLTLEQKDLIFRARLPEIMGLMEDKGWRVTRREEGGVIILEATGGVSGAIVYGKVIDQDVAERVAEHRRVVFLGLEMMPLSLPSVEATYFDLTQKRVIGVQDRLADEVREFCWKRGIRFSPLLWRYGQGHMEEERFFERRGAE